MRQLRLKIVGDPLDQEITEADAGKTALAVGDRIKDRGVGLARIDHRRALVEQRLDVSGNALDQRHLDEDQGLVGHARMEEGEAAPVGLEPMLEVIPGADLVHGLVSRELLEERRRRITGDELQFEETDIEPAALQSAKVALEARDQ